MPSYTALTFDDLPDKYRIAGKQLSEIAKSDGVSAENADAIGLNWIRSFMIQTHKMADMERRKRK
jgi:hypothetical protein